MKAMKGRDVLKAFVAAGWIISRQNGSHKQLENDGKHYSFQFAAHEEIGPKMVSRICKKTGLTIA